LYQAIGSSNLRAYADQDAVGHAAISKLVPVTLQGNNEARQLGWRAFRL